MGTEAERARALVQREKTGALSTLDPDGFPYGSYVTHALDGADPVFLISKLATHTQHLLRDPRASLMVHDTGADDPLANGRVTLVGPCAPMTDTASARAAFLSVHPAAAEYESFKDFSYYRLEVRSIRFIAGFGRMSWIDLEEWRLTSLPPSR